MLATLGALLILTPTIRHLSGLLGERRGGLVIGLPISTALTLSYCLCSPRLALAVAARAPTSVAAVSCLAAGWVLDGMARSTRSQRSAEAALG